MRRAWPSTGFALTIIAVKTKGNNLVTNTLS